MAEVFTVAWRRREQVPSSEPLPWLYAIARRVLANERRRQERAEDLVGRLGEQLRVPAGEDAEDPASKRLAETLAALATLGPADQEVLRLHAWEECDGRALAVALGCSLTAAAVRLHRARRRLRQAVGSASGGSGPPSSAVMDLHVTDGRGAPT